MLGNNRGRTLKTTRTSLRVLELVLEHGGLTLAELDGMVEGPKSTLHSHLTTLHECRYLIREGDTYQAGFRLALLGDQARRGTPVDAIGADVVDDLAEKTGEESNLTVLEHGRLLLAYTSQSPDSEEVGFRTEYYLHNTAAGKAILAEMDRERADEILDEWGMSGETKATITDRDRLFETLADAAERGYGIVDEEVAPGLVAVGAPVHDADGAILGGLSVGGPKYRLDTSRLHQDIADSLLEAVEVFENSLGN